MKYANINKDITKKDTRMLQWSLETKAESTLNRLVLFIQIRPTSIIQLL